MSYFNTDDATFNPQLEKINETDRVHADTPNQRFDQLIKNDVSLKNQLDTHNHDSLYSNINHKHSEYITNENLGTKLNNVAKETSEYNIENKVKEISISIGNINNSVSQNLQGVAKERSEYSIEDKVKILEDNIPKYYYDLHYNYIEKQVSSIPLNNEILLSEATGQGELVHCFLGFRGTGTNNNDRPAYKFKIVIDGEVKLFHTVYLMGKVSYPKAGFFSYTNISHYEADYTTPYQSRCRYYPYSYLPIIRKNGSSYETSMGVTVCPRNYIMHPLSSKEKKLYVNGELIFTQGTIEMKPIKYKNKVQVYLTLLDRLDQLTEINLSMYYKPND